MHRKIEEARKRIAREQHTLDQIIAGLDGQPFKWAKWERHLYQKAAQTLSLTLISKSALTKRGYALKRGAKPVGSAYYGAPIQKYVDLYILEVQCKATEGKSKPNDIEIRRFPYSNDFMAESALLEAIASAFPLPPQQSYFKNHELYIRAQPHGYTVYTGVDKTNTASDVIRISGLNFSGDLVQQMTALAPVVGTFHLESATLLKMWKAGDMAGTIRRLDDSVVVHIETHG